MTRWDLMIELAGRDVYLPWQCELAAKKPRVVREYIEKVCIICSRPFTPNGNTQITCPGVCAKTREKQRKQRSPRA